MGLREGDKAQNAPARDAVKTSVGREGLVLAYWEASQAAEYWRERAEVAEERLAALGFGGDRSGPFA